MSDRALFWAWIATVSMAAVCGFAVGYYAKTPTLPDDVMTRLYYGTIMDNPDTGEPGLWWVVTDRLETRWEWADYPDTLLVTIRYTPPGWEHARMEPLP